MKLTKDNILVYAAAHYSNEMCITEEEFFSDLSQLKTIRRMMTRFVNGEESNLRLLTNNVIIFYNCFEHHAASHLIQFHINDEHIEYFNTILYFLSFPLLTPQECINLKLYRLIQEEFK